MLAGYLDTMPPGNLSSWQTDPYELTRADDRLAGDLTTAILTQALGPQVHSVLIRIM
jgi:hypothetical protein